MRKFLFAVAAVGLLAGTACSSDDGNKTTTTTSGGGTAPAVSIDAKGTTWEPDDVTVKTGEVVEWVVDGSIVHDLKGDEGVSHKAASKFTVKHTFKTAGVFAYQCTIHPGMTGNVTVTS